MGMPKALMDVGGRPWWRVQAERLRVAQVEAVWVVSERVRDELAMHDDRPRRVVVANDRSPMFESLIAGVRSMRADPPTSLFVLPVDVPAPGPATWRTLAARGRPAIPSYRGRGGHPICLPWDWIETNLSESRLGTLAPDERRLDVLTRADAVTIEICDRAVAANLNDPRDLGAWLRPDGEA
jgi:CTP:molybdopterin cytidylyltransferase MocA